MSGWQPFLAGAAFGGAVVFCLLWTQLVKPMARLLGIDRDSSAVLRDRERNR